MAENLLKATSALNKLFKAKDIPLKYLLWKWVLYSRGAGLDEINRGYGSGGATEVFFISKDEANAAIDLVLERYGKIDGFIEIYLQLKNAINGSPDDGPKEDEPDVCLEQTEQS